MVDLELVNRKPYITSLRDSEDFLANSILEPVSTLTKKHFKPLPRLLFDCVVNYMVIAEEVAIVFPHVLRMFTIKEVCFVFLRRVIEV